jgi:hypothetical protein
MDVEIMLFINLDSQSHRVDQLMDLWQMNTVARCYALPFA